jgi:hypothetical protein
MNAVTAIEMADPDPLRLAMFDCSDWGNARRLIEIAGGKLKWVEDLQTWAHYDGTRWSVERGASRRSSSPRRSSATSTSSCRS